MDDSLATMYVPVVPQINEAALRRLGEQIRVTVAQAVRDGINDARSVEPDRYDSFADPAAFDAKLNTTDRNRAGLSCNCTQSTPGARCKQQCMVCAGNITGGI